MGCYGMLSLIGAATSEPPMPAPFLTLIAACRPVQMGDFGIGSVLNGECKAMRCWQAGQHHFLRFPFFSVPGGHLVVTHPSG